MENVFIGKIHKLLYPIGNVTVVYTVGQKLPFIEGAVVSRIVRDNGYFAECNMERVLVYITLADGGEIIYDDVKGLPHSLRTDVK